MRSPLSPAKTTRVRSLDLLLLLVVFGVLVGLLWLRLRPAAGDGSAGSPGPTQLAEASSTATASPIRDFTVQIEDGLAVKWNVDAAAASALAQIKNNERVAGQSLAEPKILSVVAITGTEVPADMGEGNLGEWGVVWIVRAEGTFVAGGCIHDAG